jgi:uncharacterized membrane protein YfcA
LIGAGGSILTVPVLVYLFAIRLRKRRIFARDRRRFRGGGRAEYWRRKQNNPKMALVFGIPSILGVYLTRRYLFPAVPNPVFEASRFILSKDVAVMIFLLSLCCWRRFP